MILQLMRRDPAWKSTPWLTLTAAIGTLFYAVRHADPFFAGMAAPIYLVVFMRTLPHQRATFFEAALPVSGRDLFLARFLSLTLLTWLPAAAVALVLAVNGYRAAIAGGIAVIAIVLTLGTVAILSVRVTQFAAPSWLTIATPTFASIILVPAFVYRHGLAVGAVGVTAAIALGARTWKSIPEAFQSAPTEVSIERKSVGSAAPSQPWLPILRSLFPWQLALFAPISLVWVVTGDWIFASMYMMIGYSQARVTSRWTLALPVSRRVLFAASTIPMLLLLAGSAEVGMLTGVSKQGKNLIRQGDPDHFRATGALDVAVSRAFWKWAPGGRIPAIEAPWGETVQPDPFRVLGLTFYNPYAVGQRNSFQFQDWQFARATTEVYGRPITARQLAEGKQRHLTPVTLSPRMQILSMATVVAITLLWLWLAELLSWHRLGRLSTGVRNAITYSGASIILLSVIALDILAGRGSDSISQAAVEAGLLYLSRLLPANLVLVAAIALAPLLVLFWIVDRQGSVAEISQKLEQNQSLFARLGGRP